MIPVSYGYRNVLVRWRTTLMTATGFTLVVAALIVMLAFFNGIRAACVGTGQAENVIVLNKGNLDEVLSQIDTITARRVEGAAAEAVLGDADGQLLVSRELYIVVTETDPETQEPALLQVRGIQPGAWKVHSRARLIAGRMIRPGQGELLVGSGFQADQRLNLGDPLRLGPREWRVVGVFDAGGSTFETEIWADLGELAGLFRRKSFYSSIVLKTASASASKLLAADLTDSRQFAVDAQPESDYYSRQVAQLDTIRTGALVVVAFMAIGAVFGVTNTMFAAIGQRIKDIAVMRLMGFERREILLSFLLETMIIATIGGVLGGLLGYMVNGATFSAALGAKSVAFAFHVDRGTLILAGCLTCAMGVIGGLLPAFSATRVSPLESLR